jgi:hypothetical protein
MKDNVAVGNLVLEVAKASGAAMVARLLQQFRAMVKTV